MTNKSGRVARSFGVVLAALCLGAAACSRNAPSPAKTSAFAPQSVAAYQDWLALEHGFIRPLENGQTPDWAALNTAAAEALRKTTALTPLAGTPTERGYAAALDACVRKLGVMIDAAGAQQKKTGAFAYAAFEADLTEYKTLKLNLLAATPR